MTITITKCDNCGIEKKESNNWYHILANLHFVGIIKSEEDADKSTKDACGEECATKLIWENMKR